MSKRTPAKLITRPTKPKTYLVNLSTWRWEGIVVLGGTAKQVEDIFYKKFKAEVDVDQESRGQAFFNKDAPWMIWVKSPNDFAALSHEALHITLWVLRNRGVGTGPASDETFCYTQEDIVQQVINQF